MVSAKLQAVEKRKGRSEAEKGLSLAIQAFLKFTRNRQKSCNAEMEEEKKRKESRLYSTN